MSRTRKPQRDPVADWVIRDQQPGSELVGARNLPLELIDVNPDQPRQTFNERSLTRLANSIKRHGVIEPIIVRSAHGRYIIVAGEQRRRAAVEAGLDVIPALVQENISNERASTFALVENLQRGDVPPAETAEAIDRLQRQTGWGVRRIGREVGRSHAWVSLSLALVRNRPDLLQQMKARQITFRQAVSLLNETPEDESGKRLTTLEPSEPGDHEVSRAVLDKVRPVSEPREVSVAGYTRRAYGKSFKPWVQARTYLLKFAEPGAETIVARIPDEDVDLFIREAEEAHETLYQMLEWAKLRKMKLERETTENADE